MRRIASDHHSREALATHPACQVEQCACGQVHLSIGGVTLRLDRDAFFMIADVCASAARVAAVRALVPDDDPRLS